MKPNKYFKYLISFSASGLMLAGGCVNPPQRTSATIPPIPPVPAEPAAKPPQTDDGSRVKELPNGGGGGGGGDGGGGAPVVPPAASAKSQVSYWLNKTDSNNCLTIQPQGAASISAKCSLDGATLGDWIAQDLTPANPSQGATIRIETANRVTKQNFTTASDNPADNAWRWRCVKTKDSAKQLTVHTVCYEDGNSTNKVFESSDLFVRFVGPETVDLGAVKCTAANDIDMPTCMPK